VAAGAYFALELRAERSRYETADKRVDILEKLEQGEITAESANQMLNDIGQVSWARLAADEAPTEPRQMRIRVSEMATGLTKVDLHLPVGLVNTVLYVGGYLSSDLGDDETDRLREMVAQNPNDEQPQTDETRDERMEISLE
jgi:hypothetical protein